MKRMMGRKSNPNLVNLIDELIKASKKAAIWKDLAERLAKPRKLYAVVNVSKIERFAKDKEYVVVPGKVLGYGNLSKAVKVAALSFSRSARDKIESAGGECLRISELLKINPEGSNVKILS